MKWIKYAASGIAIVLLTALVLLFPDVYQRYSMQNGAALHFREINLEQSQQELTQQRVLRILYENAANNVRSEVQNTKSIPEYKNDCKEILRAVFGEENSGELPSLLLNQLENARESTVKTFRFLTLSGEDIISLNLILARFDNLYLLYEEETKAAVQIAVYSNAFDLGEPYGVNEYTTGIESEKNYCSYYHSLGIKDGEFGYYAYNDPSGTRFFVSLIGYEYLIEMEINKEIQN